MLLEALGICIRRDPIFTSGFRIQNIQCLEPSIFLSVPGLCWLFLCHSLPYLLQFLLASAFAALRTCQFLLSAPRMVPSLPQKHFRFKFVYYPALCVLVHARWAQTELYPYPAFYTGLLIQSMDEPISQQTGPFVSNLKSWSLYLVSNPTATD